MNMKVFLRIFLAIWAASAMAQETVSVPTNAAPGAATSGGTNADLTAKPPGDLFTNSVEMELIKTGSFWAGKFEVTQKQYQKVTGMNPSAFGGDDNPVDSVSWSDAMAFCEKLTEKDIKAKKLPDGYYYTLPTEGEWETLAADADLKDAVTSQGGTSRGGTSPVGSLGPNSMGLYDTRGNVMEFCLGDTGKPYRVLRGGSWSDSIEINLRTEFRFYCTPDDHKNTFGFRCVLKSN
jgi:formylglycine-generating enzyme required for sulfatase activity